MPNTPTELPLDAIPLQQLLDRAVKWIESELDHPEVATLIRSAPLLSVGAALATGIVVSTATEGTPLQTALVRIRSQLEQVATAMLDEAFDIVRTGPEQSPETD